MERWNGRVALVTGASVGIGAAICKALLKEGLVVIGCARDVQKIRESAEDVEAKFPGKLHAIKCDLAEETDIMMMFEKINSIFGRLDICINNAGVCSNSPLLSGETNDWKNMLMVNILALCICTREAVKLMRENEVQEGQIINISSMGGHKLPDPPMPGFNFYCGTKSMIKTITDGLRLEVIDGNGSLNHIRVASISPGLTETEFLTRCFNPEIAQSVYASTSCLSPNDVADAVLYILRSPSSVNVNDVLVTATETKKVRK